MADKVLVDLLRKAEMLSDIYTAASCAPPVVAGFAAEVAAFLRSVAASGVTAGADPEQAEAIASALEYAASWASYNADESVTTYLLGKASKARAGAVPVPEQPNGPEVRE